MGDPNRPTQLGEKFSELYDNEWTDAMEELGNSGDEKGNISTLRNIVEVTQAVFLLKLIVSLSSLCKLFTVFVSEMSPLPINILLYRTLDINSANVSNKCEILFTVLTSFLHVFISPVVRHVCREFLLQYILQKFPEIILIVYPCYKGDDFMPCIAHG